MFEHIASTVQAELSDLNDVTTLTRVCLRLFFAALLGAVVGYERERRDSSAGLRTHMLVAVGCAVFVVAPQETGVSPGDLTRVLQGVIAGVGFLGAGAVLKFSDQGEIRGLTTAASIWATAAIGTAVGLGRTATAIAATLLVLFILTALFHFEKWMTARKQEVKR